MHFPSLSAHFSNRTAVLYCTELVGLSFIWPSDVAVRVIMALSRPPLLALYMPILLMIVPSFIAPPPNSLFIIRKNFIFISRDETCNQQRCIKRWKRSLPFHKVQLLFVFFSSVFPFIPFFFLFETYSFIYLFFIFSSFNPYSVPSFCVSFRSH